MEKVSRTQGRFSKVFSGDSCSLPSYDRALQKYDGCAVVPTLGSILPNWLLIVPEAPALNFRDWEAVSNVSAISLVSKFLASRSIGAERAIWFEHGPSRAGTDVGCGLDHAHLHVLIDAPFTFGEFRAAAEEKSGQLFRPVPSASVFSAVPPDVSYLLMGSGNSASLAVGIEKVGSQFLRRVVADLVGQSDGWNYRSHPWLGNVQKTVQAFSPV